MIAPDWCSHAAVASDATVAATSAVLAAPENSDAASSGVAVDAEPGRQPLVEAEHGGVVGAVGLDVGQRRQPLLEVGAEVGVDDAGLARPTTDETAAAGEVDDGSPSANAVSRPPIRQSSRHSRASTRGGTARCRGRGRRTGRRTRRWRRRHRRSAPAAPRRRGRRGTRRRGRGRGRSGRLAARWWCASRGPRRRRPRPRSRPASAGRRRGRRPAMRTRRSNGAPADAWSMNVFASWGLTSCRPIPAKKRTASSTRRGRWGRRYAATKSRTVLSGTKALLRSARDGRVGAVQAARSGAEARRLPHRKRHGDGGLDGARSHVETSRSHGRPTLPPPPAERKRIGTVDDCYEAEVIFAVTLKGRRRDVRQPRALTYPPEGVGAPKHRRPGPLVERGSAGRNGGVLGGRPHLVGGGHLLRALPGEHEGPRAARHERRWRVGHRCGREVDPRTRVHRGAHAVRPSPWVAHGRRRGPTRRPRLGGDLQGAGVPELDPRLVRMAGPRGPRALLPDLQRAHRGGPGAIERPHLRRRA